MINCIIVDDEPLAIEVIESHLEKIDDINIVATCPNAVKAFEVLQKKEIDLMFLDIQMPKLTGIDFLKTLKNPPQVILTTAYRDYALEGYELDVVDYLLKPISFERFLKAIGKVYQKGSKSNQSFVNEPEESFIYLKADKKTIKVHLNDIVYIESLRDYVRVKTKVKEIVTHQKISKLEDLLPKEEFIRIHRSFIVSIKKIEAFSSKGVELPGKLLPIGRLYKSQVMETLNEGVS